MARSPADATRFTATGPYASSRASTIDLSAPPPPNETPAQKVARLREAARRAKLQDISTWDRLLLRGRFVADKAHKFTATALMGASVLCVVVGGIALAEQISHNRKKKLEWHAEQKRNYDVAVEKARAAEAEGKLTGDLALFLNHERAVEQAETQQVAKVGVFSKIKNSLWSGLATEEQPGGKMGFASDYTKTQVAQRLKTLDSEVQAASNAGVEELGAEVTNDVLTNRTRGGALDQLGANAANAVVSTSRSWMDWWRGR